MSSYEPIRCCFCGKFMSDDDVLLGVTDDEGRRYGHMGCYEKMMAKQEVQR